MADDVTVEIFIVNSIYDCLNCREEGLLLYDLLD